MDSSRVITLLLAGDVNLSGPVNAALREHPPSYPWGDTLPIWGQPDLRICNLECSFTDHGRRWGWPIKKYHHRSDEQNVAVLRAAAIDMAVVGNNHTYDYGAAGLARTLAALDAAGIAHAGAGPDRAAAEAPAIRTVNGVRVGMVSFLDDEWPSAAGPSRAGRFYSPINLRSSRAQRVLDAVRQARRQVDVLIASAHWGPNWGDDPPAVQRPFGRALIDAGADIVYGHSGHVLRGIELYRDRPILYSTGDVVDGYSVSSKGRNDHSALFLVTWEAGSVTRIALEPIVIRDCQARSALPRDAAVIVARMQRLCAELGTRLDAGPDGRSMVVRL